MCTHSIDDLLPHAPLHYAATGEMVKGSLLLLFYCCTLTIAPPDSSENEDKVSITNPTYAKHEHMDSGEIGPADLHRGESNLSIAKEEQKYINKVPEDNASDTLGDDAQHEAEDENGYESAAEDLPDNNSTQSRDNHSNVAKSDNEDSNIGGGGGGGGGALGGYAGDSDEDHMKI